MANIFRSSHQKAFSQSVFVENTPEPATLLEMKILFLKDLIKNSGKPFHIKHL